MSGFGSMGVKRCDRITGIQTNANWLVNMYHFVIFVPFQFSEVIRVDAETCFLWYIMKINIATLRSNLGISTLLEILQSCKLDHKLILFSTWLPPTHPPLLGQNRNKIVGGCLETTSYCYICVRWVGWLSSLYVGWLVPHTFYSHFVVQLARLQDFKLSWNSQVGPSVAKNSSVRMWLSKLPIRNKISWAELCSTQVALVVSYQVLRG